MISLFLSPAGRIGRAPYFWGLLAVVIFGTASLFLPPPWLLACLLFAWPKLCLHIKRLHDIGRPSSTLITPIVFNIFAAIVACGIFFAAITSGGLAAVRSREADMAVPALVALAILGVAWIAGNLAFVGWLAFKRGDAEANPYGPAPARA